MEYCMYESFESLTKRVLYAYPVAYPSFVPVKCGVDQTSQKDMYDFMENALITIYERPEEFGFEMLPDGCLEAWELANTKPNLIKEMEKVENRFVGIILSLIKIGQAGTLLPEGMSVLKESKAITKNGMSILVLLGVSCTAEKDRYVLQVPRFPSLFHAWKVYAEADCMEATKVDRTISFIYGKYYGRIYTATDFFGKLFGNISELGKLEKFFSENGFTCMNSMLNAKTRYACTKWSKDYENGQKAYMSICYDWKRHHPVMINFHLPCFKIMLEHRFTAFDQDMQHFIFERLKECDSCGYCTQTDKSGKREKLSRIMTCDDKSELKCPLYPNFMFEACNPKDMQHMKVLFENAEAVTK